MFSDLVASKPAVSCPGNGESLVMLIIPRVYIPYKVLRLIYMYILQININA